MAIRLVLAEDHYLVREGVRQPARDPPDFEVAAVCGDLSSLLAAVDAEGRTSSSPTSGCRRAAPTRDPGRRAAARDAPGVGVVVLSQYANPGYVLALLEGGSARRAYLLKERLTDLEQLVAAIRAVAEGGSVIDAEGRRGAGGGERPR